MRLKVKLKDFYVKNVFLYMVNIITVEFLVYLKL